MQSHRDTETQRQRDRETERQRDRETETERICVAHMSTVVHSRAADKGLRYNCYYSHYYYCHCYC